MIYIIKTIQIEYIVLIAITIYHIMMMRSSYSFTIIAVQLSASSDGFLLRAGIHTDCIPSSSQTQLKSALRCSCTIHQSDLTIVASPAIITSY